MKTSYKDILSRLGEPLWWDVYGVPRYEPFSIELTGVYSHTVVLLKIECQACNQKFTVAQEYQNLRYAPNQVRYNDLPRHDCVGDQCASNEFDILQWWQYDHHEWSRITIHEGKVRYA
jgi:hypothetical protein